MHAYVYYECSYIHIMKIWVNICFVYVGMCIFFSYELRFAVMQNIVWLREIKKRHEKYRAENSNDTSMIPKRKISRLWCISNTTNLTHINGGLTPIQNITWYRQHVNILKRKIKPEQRAVLTVPWHQNIKFCSCGRYSIIPINLTLRIEDWHQYEISLGAGNRGTFSIKCEVF